MVRRSAYELVGIYDPSTYGLGCDKDMWFRLSEIGDVAYVERPQALITARQKGDPTSQFSWSDVVGSVRMRENHIERAFLPGTMERALNATKFALQRDIRFLRLLARAILLESHDVAERGIEVIYGESSVIFRLLAILMQRSSLLRRLMRGLVLPMHYRGVSRWYKSQKSSSAEYLATDSSIETFLQGYGLQGHNSEQ
jgi:hypothetical protein